MKLELEDPEDFDVDEQPDADTQIEEVSSDLGEPDCKLIEPLSSINQLVG